MCQTQQRALQQAKEDLEVSRETIAVQKELIAKLESRDVEQRRLLLNMTHERDQLRAQVCGTVSDAAMFPCLLVVCCEYKT